MLVVFGEARDLPQRQASVEEANLFVGQHVFNRLPVEAGAVAGEVAGGHPTEAALAAGEDVEALGEQRDEELRAPPASVEDDGEPSVADEAAHFAEDDRQHLHHAGVGRGGDDEERISLAVVDPVVGRRRHGQAHSGDVRFREGVFAVVHADVAVEGEEAHRFTQ